MILKDFIGLIVLIEISANAAFQIIDVVIINVHSAFVRLFFRYFVIHSLFVL